MEDLQNLLEKIKREGVDKATAEADRIIAEAREKAKTVLEEAKAEAARVREAAEKDAADYAARAEESVRQSSRDVLLKLEGSVTAMLEKLLAKDVRAGLSDPAAVGPLVMKAVDSLVSTGTVEVVLAEELAAALKAELASRSDIKVVIDPASGSGFSVRLDGGRVEHSFTGEVVAAELARRLRPDLARLVK